MTGIFKSISQEIKDLMKHMGLIVPILLLLGVGITSGLAAGQNAMISAGQQIERSEAPVGEPVMVMLTLSNSGMDSAQVTVSFASFPSGVVTQPPGTWIMELQPGRAQNLEYPVQAVQSGSYLISSRISYMEEGMRRELSMESPFTAIGDGIANGNSDQGGVQNGDVLPGGQMENGLAVTSGPNTLLDGASASVGSSASGESTAVVLPDGSSSGSATPHDGEGSAGQGGDGSLPASSQPGGQSPAATDNGTNGAPSSQPLPQS